MVLRFRPARVRLMLGIGLASALGCLGQELTVDDLPRGSSPPALPTPHFPDRLHAFVFRNWELVPLERMAAVVGATPAQLKAIGWALGLPDPPHLSADFQRRVYLTVLRRNWHLLPYEQLVELVGMTPRQLGETLREDDFLYIKLGQLKPACPPLRYVDPSPEATMRAAEIRAELRAVLGAAATTEGVPRFEFLRAWEDQSGRLSSSAALPVSAPAASGRFATRYVYSYVALFGDPLLDEQIDPFPDGLLAQLAAVGVNGVWLHVVLRDLAPGGEDFPEFGQQQQLRLVNLRKLVRRAAAQGIGVYLYLNEPRAMPQAFFRERPQLAGASEGEFTAMCTATPSVQNWLRDALTHVFREVPELAGVFTITASENFTNCASHGHPEGCPRCRGRSEADIIAEVNRVIAEGVRRAKPQARVIAWDWGWNRHGDASEHIGRLPPGIDLMSVSEWSLPIERGGIRSSIGEYSLSAVGPGPRAARHWELARARGLGAFAKVQFNNSWELAAVPFLPVLDLVAEHCRNLATAGVDGLMLSWSLGGYPSMNLEVAQAFNLRPDADPERVLQEIAERHYGARGGPLARSAWSEFSSAFRQYPYDGSLVYHGPQLLGPSNLLYLTPTGYRATMTGFPYDDLTAWRGIYPPEIFLEQFTQVAEGWARGVAKLQEAVAAAPTDLRAAAAADLRIAAAAECHFRSVVQQTRFVMLRAQLGDPTIGDADRAAIRKQLRQTVAAELATAHRLWQLTREDSRIGFEASNQYLYVPTDLAEKIVNCRWILGQLPE